MRAAVEIRLVSSPLPTRPPFFLPPAGSHPEWGHSQFQLCVAVQRESVTVSMSAVTHYRTRFFSAEALPPHKVVTLPALSPTMEVGSLVGWEKAEGELVEEGDVLARVETDKASMEMEAPHTGYVAKTVVPEGTRDIPLGKVIYIITENESDVPLCGVLVCA